MVSDVDGTITKSDVLGHVMTAIGRDWSHVGVTKLMEGDLFASGQGVTLYDRIVAVDASPHLCGTLEMGSRQATDGCGQTLLD